MSLESIECIHEGGQSQRKITKEKTESLENDQFQKLLSKLFTLKNTHILKEPEIDTNQQDQRIVFLLLASAGLLVTYASIWSIILTSKNRLSSVRIQNQNFASFNDEYTG